MPGGIGGLPKGWPSHFERVNASKQPVVRDPPNVPLRNFLSLSVDGGAGPRVRARGGVSEGGSVRVRTSSVPANPGPISTRSSACRGRLGRPPPSPDIRVDEGDATRVLSVTSHPGEVSIVGPIVDTGPQLRFDGLAHGFASRHRTPSVRRTRPAVVGPGSSDWARRIGRVGPRSSDSR
ncbi:hypothetical protein FRAAL5687 [Frankia alni ACN14a]|uniref:Uncharacterized protein n=1 Tax=Frankia alni (strain DSM 45986 / CECT 9034 / ACN14a) TaxID=326424 RepID=Q0RDZ6_FRAAA|nr:hypothetical protein FRAAL5687 [Frankia alni ACN14a]